MISKNQIKQVTALQQKKYRDAEQLFIAEGIKTVEEILNQRPDILEHLFATEDFITKHISSIQSASVDYSVVNDAELKRISMQVNPNQVLAVCHYFNDKIPSTVTPHQHYLYLDDIRDPGNLGTIIRLADWFGIHTVFCSPDSVDLYNNKVIQSCMGAFLRIKVVYANLEQVIREYQFKKIYGAVLDGASIYEAYLGPGLIVIGNEANGISKENRKRINAPVSIPAHGQNGTESLNAAIATGIICGEFFRQTQI